MLLTHLNVGINDEFENVSLTCSQKISSHSVPCPPSLPYLVKKKSLRLFKKKGYPVFRNRQLLAILTLPLTPINMNNSY